MRALGIILLLMIMKQEDLVANVALHAAAKIAYGHHANLRVPVGVVRFTVVPGVGFLCLKTSSTDY